jgi:hypothetical protein
MDRNLYKLKLRPLRLHLIWRKKMGPGEVILIAHTTTSKTGLAQINTVAEITMSKALLTKSSHPLGVLVSTVKYVLPSIFLGAPEAISKSTKSVEIVAGIPTASQ